MIPNFIIIIATSLSAAYVHVSPALCHPNDMRFEGGLVAIQIENKLIKKLAKSDNM